MSTTLKSLNNTLGLTRFSGGVLRGTCVQVTQTKQKPNHANPLGMGYLQLTREEAGQLAELLNAFANCEEVEDEDAELVG
jgi:hypothetical protein